MYYIYDKKIVISLLENLHIKKYIKQRGKLYELCINNNNLILNVYDDNSPNLLDKTYQLEKNVKGEFGICEDEQKDIHIIVANKKYDLIYIRFDGEKFEKETVYYFNNTIGIPTTPIILVKNNLIVIALEFITTGMEKKWSLQVYTKRNGLWVYNIIDKDIGLCYIQPDFKLDDQENLHLIYREYKEKSYIKYICFDTQKPQREKAKIILESENNKYIPYIFIKEFNEIFVCWVEISDNDANLCCANISTDLAQDIFKVDITKNISNTRIYFDGLHIYCIFSKDDRYYYDMCCGKKMTK